MPFERNEPYDVDAVLLERLGLPTWQAAHHEETLVGEVRPCTNPEEPGKATKIQIYVTCCPAQFFRFVIERKSEDEDYRGMERVEVSTGSGTLSSYWPMALAIASHCLVVGPVERLNV